MEIQAATTHPHDEYESLPILLVSRGWFHPHPFARQALFHILNAIPGSLVTTCATLEKLPEDGLRAYPAAVLYFHERDISPAALRTLETYVQSGGGLLALHAAAASYKNSPRHYELLGGRFVAHGAVQEITIAALPASQPIFGHRPDFSIRDEFYRMDTRADITVLFTASDDGQREPFAWTRQPGEGRIFYLAAGHTTSSLRHPAVQELVQRGLLWCAGKNLPDESA